MMSTQQSQTSKLKKTRRMRGGTSTRIIVAIALASVTCCILPFIYLNGRIGTRDARMDNVEESQCSCEDRGKYVTSIGGARATLHNLPEGKNGRVDEEEVEGGEEERPSSQVKKMTLTTDTRAKQLRENYLRIKEAEEENEVRKRRRGGDKKRKTIMCCVALHEEAYIDEFVDYHLGIGFRKIIVYDNSERYELKQWARTRNKHRRTEDGGSSSGENDFRRGKK